MSWCVRLPVVVIILFESCRGLIGHAGRRKAKKWPGLSKGSFIVMVVIVPCACVCVEHLMAMRQMADKNAHNRDRYGSISLQQSRAGPFSRHHN